MVPALSYYAMMIRKDFMEYAIQKIQPMGLTPGYLYFIIYIGKFPGCRQGDLAKRLQLDLGYTARTLNKLEKQGFLIQEQNPRDRRARMLNLTPKGQEAFQISYDLFYQWDEEAKKAFTSEEWNMAEAILEKLVHGKKLNGS